MMEKIMNKFMFLSTLSIAFGVLVACGEMKTLSPTNSTSGRQVISVGNTPEEQQMNIMQSHKGVNPPIALNTSRADLQGLANFIKNYGHHFNIESDAQIQRIDAVISLDYTDRFNTYTDDNGVNFNGQPKMVLDIVAYDASNNGIQLTFRGLKGETFNYYNAPNDETEEFNSYYYFADRQYYTSVLSNSMMNYYLNDSYDMAQYDQWNGEVNLNIVNLDSQDTVIPIGSFSGIEDSRLF
tara:strand:- start:66179 stop:66895 length:717 start_codon:yes stop_codon:yes gene_type:complete